MSFDRQTWLWILAGLLLVFWAARKLRSILRRRRPARVSPHLLNYSEGTDLAESRRTEAAKIVATSTSDHVAGYRIVEQVEAVFVDGFRRPEEAVEGLKAAAAMKGANAVTNVRQERTASGRCSASGDAVIIQKHRTDS